MKFLEYLNQQQNKASLPQNQFALYLGVDKAQLSRIMTGVRKPPVSFIYRVCTKFNDDKLIPSFIKERLS